MALQLYKIATVEIGSAGAATIAFSSIPQGYTDLKLVLSARSSGAEVSGGAIGIVTLNGSSANLSSRILGGNGTSAYSSTDASNLSIRIDPGDVTSNTFGNGEMYIPNYISSNSKSLSLDHIWEQNATLARVELTAGLYSSASAISSITITPGVGTFVQYSTATLYGIL